MKTFIRFSHAFLIILAVCFTGCGSMYGDMLGGGSGGGKTYPGTVFKTGQTTCYNSSGTLISCGGTGQDGELQKGASWPNPRFTDNGNGTVTDNMTGLMWLENANQASASFNFSNGLSYVFNMNTGAGTFGYKDWRMPNIMEIRSLANYYDGYFADWLEGWFVDSSVQGDYLSSTSNAANPANVWTYNARYGYLNSYGKANPSYIWPVRSASVIARTGEISCYDTSGGIISCAGTGQDGEQQQGIAWPNPRFTDNGDGTVSDNLTGLMWLKNADYNNGGLSWQAALDYIKNTINAGAGTHGHNDWRLPNVNEVESLVNWGQNSSQGSWLSVTFSNLKNYYWTSTTNMADQSNAWYLSTNSSVSILSAGGTKTNTFWVWPVRGGQ